MDLGRLVDRAAGALSHSHPELTSELTARADGTHEPPDPFDSFTGNQDVDWFRTFGYLVLRGFFEPALVAELQSELARTMLAVHGDRYYKRPAMGGMARLAGHDTCLLGPFRGRRARAGVGASAGVSALRIVSPDGAASGIASAGPRTSLVGRRTSAEAVRVLSVASVSATRAHGQTRPGRSPV